VIVIVGRAAEAEDRVAAVQLKASGPLRRNNFQHPVRTVVVGGQGYDC